MQEYISQLTPNLRSAKKPEKMARGASDSAIVRAAIRQGEPLWLATWAQFQNDDSRRAYTGSEPIASGRMRRNNAAARKIISRWIISAVRSRRGVTKR